MVAVAFGFVATLFSSALNVTPNGLVGATWFGWPMAWMYNLVTYPPATNISYTNVFFDVVGWAVIGAIVLLVATRMKK